MKKIIATLLALCTLTSMSACGSSKKTEPVTTLTTEALTTIAPTKSTEATTEATEATTETTESTTEATEATTETTESTTEATEATTEATPKMVEAKRISKVTCAFGYSYDLFEYNYQYKDEDPLQVYVYEKDVPQWERHFYPGGMTLKAEITFAEDGSIIDRSEYDEAGNLITETFITAPGGETITRRHDYNDQGLVTAVSILNEGSDPYLLESWTYDDQGQLMEHIDYTGKWEHEYYQDSLVPEELPSSTIVRETWAYDDAGRETEYYGYTNDIVTRQETWTYDQQGNVLENRSSYIYDEEGCEAYSITINTYDESGRLIHSFDEGDDPSNCWEYSTDYTYDENGTLIEQVENHHYGGVVTDSWTYDENGNLLNSVTHYNIDGWVTCTTSCTYNEAGLIIEEVYEEEYEGDFFSGHHNTWTYNDAGQIIEAIRQGRNMDTYRTVYEYDDNGNLTLCQEYEGEDSISIHRWSYDDNGDLLDYGHGGLESLAAFGEQVLILNSEAYDIPYAAVSYETVSVTEAEAQTIEQMNEYILSSL